jgi:hypothetical protein
MSQKTALFITTAVRTPRPFTIVLTAVRHKTIVMYQMHHNILILGRVLILSSHINRSLPSNIFPPDLLTNSFTYFSSVTNVARPVHSTILQLIVLVIFSEHQKLRSLLSLLLSYAQIFSSTPRSQPPNPPPGYLLPKPGANSYNTRI